MRQLKLLKQGIPDPMASENFQRIEADARADPFRKGAFDFFTFTFTAAVTRLRLAHHLGFSPLDVLQLSVTSPDTAAVTWHYDSFDATNVVLSTTGACTVRAYIGRYGEGL